MAKLSIKEMMIMAICADLGLFAKRMISPFTNILTDSLHLPGGINTAFSLMFLIVARSFVKYRFAGTVLSFIQAVIALSLGMTGSMGAYTIIAYVIPGMMIDLVFYLVKEKEMRFVCSNMIGSMSAGIVANILVFRLKSIALIFYLSLSAFSGFCFGYLGYYIFLRLKGGK